VTTRTRSRRSRTRTRPRLPAAERRAAILDAAMEVFAERGYHAASIDVIARAGGISKALIYEHFPSKQALWASLLETQVTEVFRRLAAGAATPQPGEVRLRAGVDAFLAFVEERRDAWRMLFREATDPEVMSFLDRVRSQVAGVVAALIAAEPTTNVAEGADRELAIEMLAEQLTGAVQALANWWADHQDVPREVLVERVMDFAWLGLERLRAGETSRGHAAAPAPR
jgi:AcrR family transcriptional regulator